MVGPVLPAQVGLEAFGEDRGFLPGVPLRMSEVSARFVFKRRISSSRYACASFCRTIGSELAGLPLRSTVCDRAINAVQDIAEHLPAQKPWESALKIAFKHWPNSFCHQSQVAAFTGCKVIE